MAAGDNVGINPGSLAQVTADVVTRVGDSGPSLTQFIKLLDGTDGSINAAIVDSSGALRVMDAGIHTAAKNYAITLATGTWAQVNQAATNMANRTVVHIQNDSDVSFELGFASSGALGNGTKIPSGQSFAMNLGPAVTAYLQPVSGTGKRANIIEAV